MRIAATVLIFAASLAAQTHPAHRTAIGRASADDLGKTCYEILQMSSSDWVTKYKAAKSSDSDATMRAIAVYGACYDRRTDELAAKLARTDKGPSPRERANFQSVEKAVKAFTAKALAEAQSPGDPAKAAYAGLYEKEFRYEFYEAYEPRPVTPAAGNKPNEAGAEVGGTKATSATSGAAPAGTLGPDVGSAKDAKATAASVEPSDKNAGPLTLAKNHFGALLGDLPDDQMHDLHESFGEILGPNSATPRMQLLIYQYAIFLLEAPTDKPFSPPPF